MNSESTQSTVPVAVEGQPESVFARDRRDVGLLAVTRNLIFLSRGAPFSSMTGSRDFLNHN
jgi:hypothetical protein